MGKQRYLDSMCGIIDAVVAVANAAAVRHTHRDTIVRAFVRNCPRVDAHMGRCGGCRERHDGEGVQKTHLKDCVVSKEGKDRGTAE